MTDISIYPSILSANFAALGSEVVRLQQAGADAIHFDVMDGTFVPNITFGQDMITTLKQHTTLPFDVHLMVDKPDAQYKSFLAAGADVLTVHSENTVHLDRVLADIQANGTRAGVALNPSTPFSVLEYVLDRIDVILVMAVNPGYGGQLFIPDVLRKIEDLHQYLAQKGKQIDIAVDGGVTADNCDQIAGAGANILIAGSAVFKPADMQKAIASLKGKI